MNWEKGLKRVWIILLAIGWLCLLATIPYAEEPFRQLGSVIGSMVVFGLLWLLVGRVVLWLIRGFRKDA